MLNRIYLLTTVFLYFFISIVLSQSKGGRWQFEDNGDDSADWDAFQDNGILYNQAEFNSTSPLQEGISYLWLDTTFTHNFFKVEDSNDLDFDNEDIAISAWIYPIVLNDVHYIINKGVQDTNPKTTNYALRISLSGNLEFLIRDANNQAQKTASNFKITADEWTYIAAYYNFSEKKVYMWNKPTPFAQDTLEFDQNFFANDGPLLIGSWFRNDTSNPSHRDYKGRIDDVRISGRLEDVLPNATKIDNQVLIEEKESFADINIFPNPVNASNKYLAINIRIAGAANEPNEIVIYNILGQTVYKTITSSPAANQSCTWDFRDTFGNSVTNGVYFLRISNSQNLQMKKIIVLK